MPFITVSTVTYNTIEIPLKSLLEKTLVEVRTNKCGHSSEDFLDIYNNSYNGYISRMASIPANAISDEDMKQICEEWDEYKKEDREKLINTICKYESYICQEQWPVINSSNITFLDIKEAQ